MTTSNKKEKMDCEKTPLISVIIPVYNVEKFLPTCLNSVIQQTYSNWEAICVDDKSLDRSMSILSSYATVDSRIKTIHLNKNSGTIIARMKAVNLAKGKYIVFLDSDDYLIPTALETIAKEEFCEAVDILQFCCNIHSETKVKKDVYEAAEKFLNKPVERYNGDICRLCFIDNKINQNLILKCCTAEVCKKAITLMQNIRGVCMTDVYFFFYIALCSTNYRSISDRLMNYRFGIGVSTVTKWNFVNFKRVSCERNIFISIKEYIEKNGLEKQYPEFVDMLFDWVLKIQLGRLSGITEKKDFLLGLQFLIDEWGATVLCEYLGYLYDMPLDAFRQLKENNSFLKTKSAELENENTKLQKQNDKLQKQNNYLNEINDSIVNSNFWKLTEPLRKLGSKLK
jgi:glycosyltransferase involved in cell wall biosynthesis